MAGVPRDWDYDDVLDAEDRGCGEVLLDLKLKLRPLAPGAFLALVSQDAGAPLEVPAWCRLTGHVLRDARPPFFLIEKRPHEE